MKTLGTISLLCIHFTKVIMNEIKQRIRNSVRTVSQGTKWNFWRSVRNYYSDRHDVEVRVLSRDSGDYLRVLVGNIYHSTSVSLRCTCFNFISYILCFILFTSSPRSGATALDGEYVSTDFLAASKEWFFSGFSYQAWHTYFAFHAYYVYVYRCKTV